MQFIIYTNILLRHIKHRGLQSSYRNTHFTLRCKMSSFQRDVSSAPLRNKIPLSPEHQKFIQDNKLGADIDSIGYYATLCVPAAFNKLLSVDQIRLDILRVFTQTPTITTATVLSQPSFSSWLFHCTNETTSVLVSLRTRIISRGAFWHPWDETCSRYRSYHDARINEALGTSSISYDHYVGIDIIDENWERFYRITQGLNSSLLYNNFCGQICIHDQNKMIQYKAYLVPAFNTVPFPSFDRSYLGSRTELEHWLYFIKHAHILAAKPKDLAYPSLSQAYDLMDMELWTNAEILQYVYEIVDKFHSFCLLIDEAESGIDMLLTLWPLTDEVPRLPIDELVFDARSLLLREVPSFRSLVLKFSAFLRAFTCDKRFQSLSENQLFPVLYHREISCREKLDFALKARSIAFAFDIARDLRVCLKEGKDYNLKFKEYESSEDFKHLLEII